MKVKRINKTEAVKKHLESFGSIDRLTAATRYGAYDLPDIIRRLRKKMEIELLMGYEPNSKYQLVNHSRFSKKS